MLHSELFAKHVDRMTQPLRETLGIGIEGAQLLSEPVNIRPTVINQHPGNGHSQLVEFLHLLDDVALIDVLAQ